MWLDDPILNSMSEGTSESNKVNLPYSPWAPKKKLEVSLPNLFIFMF